MNAALENLINAPAFNRGNVVHGLSKERRVEKGAKTFMGIVLEVCYVFKGVHSWSS